MREPRRIHRILDKIEKIWRENPDLRLVQLLLNLGIIAYDPPRSLKNFYYDDDMAEARLDEFIKTKAFERRS